MSGRTAAERVLLLPLDPDASAERMRARPSARCGCDIAVIISDSFGRAWRRGTVGVALGAAGLPSLVDLRGRPRPVRPGAAGQLSMVASPTRSPPPPRW